MSSGRASGEKRNEEEEADSSGGSVPPTPTPIQERADESNLIVWTDVNL